MSRATLYLFAFLLCTMPLSVEAFAIPDTYTSTNFLDSYHDAPESFTMDSLGNFSGVTTSGKTFTQNYVITSISVRLQRFTIDQAFFYVSDQGVIHADSDLQALSVYLSFHDLSLEDFG